jgi:hypothetical protein
MDAYNNPRFYRQLGKGPDRIIAEALERLAEKFALTIGEDQKTLAAEMCFVRACAPRHNAWDGYNR